MQASSAAVWVFKSVPLVPVSALKLVLLTVCVGAVVSMNRLTGVLVVFLICEKCGAVGEALSAAAAETLRAAAKLAGFTPKTPVIEINGVCAHCRDAS